MAFSIKGLKADKNSKFTQGNFDKYNPKKYFGPRPIIYRSSYELKFMFMCENNPLVKGWSSEPYSIPYMTTVIKEGKVVNKKRKYFIDFQVNFFDGTIQLVEIKPFAFTVPSNKPAYVKNKLKWDSAKAYVKSLNENVGKEKYKFAIVTERTLGIKTANNK